MLQIRVGTILGMLFLVVHCCAMQCRSSIIEVERQKLGCMNRQGSALHRGVQVLHTVTVCPAKEPLKCQVDWPNFGNYELVEGIMLQVMIANQH